MFLKVFQQLVKASPTSRRRDPLRVTVRVCVFWYGEHRKRRDSQKRSNIVRRVQALAVECLGYFRAILH